MEMDSGYTLRKTDEAKEKPALQWNPLGERGKGRPREMPHRTTEKESEQVSK